MVDLRVAKFYLGTDAFSCPVTLVTSSKPYSSFYLATSNEEDSNVNALRSGYCDRKDTSLLLLSKVPRRALCVLFLPLCFTFLLPDPSGEHSSMAAILWNKGLFNYFKIFFNNTFFLNKDR